MEPVTTTSGGMSLFTVLTIIFVVLKLTHNIAWSWVWVLSPLWIGFAVTLLIFIVFGILAKVILSR